MSTSRFVFMTPTRLSDQEHPHIRAFVHNLRTGVGSKIQAIKTSLYHAHVENDVTKHDTIVLGHYSEETCNYINVGEFSTTELRDWVTTDIPTYQEGNVAEYQHLAKIRNHYKYLDYVWEDFHKAVFGKTASESFRGGMIGAHGDKVYGYCDEWEEKNIPFYRGALLYLLTYIESEMVGYKKSQSSEFVINKYQYYLPKIIETENMQLINVQATASILGKGKNTMTQPISKKEEKFIRQTACVSPRNIDLATLKLDDNDINDQKEDCPSDMSVLETFKSLYGNEFDMTLLPQTSEGRFVDRKTEVIWRAFKVALRQQKKAISRSLERLHHKVEDNLKDDHNYIIGMEVDDKTVQFGFRPYRHESLQDALKQADKLLMKHNRSYSVFKRVARIGEELKDTPTCLIKQKESGKPPLNAFRVFTELEKYVANSEIYGDAPTGIVITLKGKYRVETVSFGKWFDFDTYQEAIGFISDWIKKEKDFAKSNEAKVAASK